VRHSSGGDTGAIPGRISKKIAAPASAQKVEGVPCRRACWAAPQEYI
jgi:hypothetical protein